MLGLAVAQVRGKKHEDILHWSRRETAPRWNRPKWRLAADANATLYVEGDIERPSGVPCRWGSPTPR